MNKKYIEKKLEFLSAEEVVTVLSNEELQETIERVLNSTHPKTFQKSYICKMVEAKQKRQKEDEFKELAKLISLPKRTINFLKKIRRENFEKYLNLKNKIINIAVDPSKDNLTKNDRIKKLFQNLSQKRKSGINYNTYNYQQMLCLISEQPNITRKQIQEEMQVEEKTVIRNVKRYAKESLVVGIKHGRRLTYTVSKQGQILVNELTLSFLNRDHITESNYTHYKNDSVPKKIPLCSQQILRTRIIDKKLRLLKIYAPRVREFLEKYSVECIENLYTYVIGQERIKNKGAYIYKVLTGCCDVWRLKCFVDLRLRSVLSEDVCQMFLREAKDLDLDLSFRLGHSLRKQASKFLVLPCYVHTTLHWIFKRIAGVTDHRCSAGNVNKAALNSPKDKEDTKLFPKKLFSPNYSPQLQL